MFLLLECRVLAHVTARLAGCQFELEFLELPEDVLELSVQFVNQSSTFLTAEVTDQLEILNLLLGYLVKEVCKVIQHCLIDTL
jgi:hypothetical protein